MGTGLSTDARSRAPHTVAMQAAGTKPPGHVPRAQSMLQTGQLVYRPVFGARRRLSTCVAVAFLREGDRKMRAIVVRFEAIDRDLDERGDFRRGCAQACLSARSSRTGSPIWPEVLYRGHPAASSPQDRGAPDLFVPDVAGDHIVSVTGPSRASRSVTVKRRAANWLPFVSIMRLRRVYGPMTNGWMFELARYFAFPANLASTV